MLAVLNCAQCAECARGAEWGCRGAEVIVRPLRDPCAVLVIGQEMNKERNRLES